VGRETAHKLQGLREKVGGAGCATWWMSATLDDGRLATVDFRDALARVTTSNSRPRTVPPRGIATPARRARPCTKTQVTLAPKGEDACATALAANVCSAYEERGGLTLVIVNTRQPRSGCLCGRQRILGETRAKDECILLHSRFRPIERDPSWSG
jgi:hypothetical protein